MGMNNMRLIKWTRRQFKRQCLLCRANNYTLSSVVMYLFIQRRRTSEIAFYRKRSLQGQFFLYLFIAWRHKWTEGIEKCLCLLYRKFRLRVSVHKTGKHHKFSAKDGNRNKEFLGWSDEINGSLANEIKQKIFSCVSNWINVPGFTFIARGNPSSF
jgi:hypothetical protein